MGAGRDGRGKEGDHAARAARTNHARAEHEELQMLKAHGAGHAKQHRHPVVRVVAGKEVKQSQRAEATLDINFNNGVTQPKHAR